MVFKKKEEGEVKPTPEAKVAVAVTVDDILAVCPDPFMLLEAVSALANSDRFRRNNPLYQIAAHYSVEQKQMREWQNRLDERAAGRS